jgi:hypothetical protein
MLSFFMLIIIDGLSYKEKKLKNQIESMESKLHSIMNIKDQLEIKLNKKIKVFINDINVKG